jgi:hypothetical protein
MVITVTIMVTYPLHKSLSPFPYQQYMPFHLQNCIFLSFGDVHEKIKLVFYHEGYLEREGNI